jgi:aldose 1-epimerase
LGCGSVSRTFPSRLHPHQRPFYTGNFLNGSARGKNATYVQYAALCLETQKFPNAINVPAWQDQVILRPGQTYRHVMVHRFSVEP